MIEAIIGQGNSRVYDDLGSESIGLTGNSCV